MIHTHIIGLPIIGKKRQLKYAIENYIKTKTNTTYTQLNNTIKSLIKHNIKLQKQLDIITLGLFSYPDIITYTTICLGLINSKYIKTTAIDTILELTKGSKENTAYKMTKWFGTNFHYFIPEIDTTITNKINLNFIKYEASLINKLNTNKPRKLALIGPYTLIKVSKLTKQNLKNTILNNYIKLFKKASKLGISYFQLEEPCINNTINKTDIKTITQFYKTLNKNHKIILTNYFTKINKLLKHIKTYGIHIDAITNKIIPKTITKFKLISIGIINGENIWISNFKNIKTLLTSLKQKHIYISTNCSTKHIPYSTKYETTKIKPLLSFSYEKLKELKTIKQIINTNHKTLHYKHNQLTITQFKTKLTPPTHTKLHKFNHIKTKTIGLKLPITTIGSFPQTQYIRQLRNQFKCNIITKNHYYKAIKATIKKIIKLQHTYKVDVISNGEIERNDMVQYFCEKLTNCYITKNGWVQSYCTRCIKPSIIYGNTQFKHIDDILEFIKPLKPIKPYHKKFIITGPITIAKWSFIKDDIPINTLILILAKQINVLLHKVRHKKIKIIQIDEPALIEFLNKYKNKESYSIARQAFRLCSDKLNKYNIQIQTHLCYSKLNRQEIELLKTMNIDVLLIEAHKNINKTIQMIKTHKLHKYMEIGIGIYNVHSNIIPKKKAIKNKIYKLIKALGMSTIWINPDCGLKTRTLTETQQFLKNTYAAVKEIKQKLP